VSMYVSTSVVHEISERCNGTHCHSCGLDETGHAFEWCLECGHGFRTEHELVDAYRRRAPRSPWWRWLLLQIAPLRGDRITFCPLCLHDFI
jgi:hypothetical protein